MDNFPVSMIGIDLGQVDPTWGLLCMDLGLLGFFSFLFTPLSYRGPVEK